MAFSTLSFHKTNFKYDVFLSFRGEDTRTNFVDHLYHALEQESIETYKDDKKLEQGKRIGKELFEAIEDSRFHVIVFSQNYASSSWCLDELVKIMECQKTMTEHTVYPIFYHVEPTEVRKQSGEFGKAFSKHEKAEAAEKWREALKEAGDLSGWELKGHEVEFIKMVVNKISLKLPSISVDENLVGMRTRIVRVLSSLNAFPDKFCMIGITGMGGIGKTTLARSVFDQICNEFEGSSFVENVRECSNSLLLGLKSLQQQVLRDVLSKQDITVNGVFDGKKMMKRMMCGRKVLVVLDDVDHIDQLKALAGEPNWFKPGSKIIITTRDKQVLVAHKVVNSIHEVNLLTDEEAICLLSRCVFGTESPILGYEKLSRQVVSYGAGLPLTITVLGSSLCDEDKDVWIDTLEKLKKIPLDETQQKLELSYIDLKEDHKEIFLDVACMLKGWKKDDAIKVLESRGFHAISGLSVLQKKYLISISRDGLLDMHDHLQEMGRYIVRRSNLDEPRKHTRLWIQEEIEEILAKDLGTEATKCIHLCSSSDINTVAVMRSLRNMEKLRFLLVQASENNSNRELDEDSQYFPNSLQYLNWQGYPFCSLPKTFLASSLVSLIMHGCTLEQLWEGGEIKVLDKLRFLQLTRSNLKTFDFRLTPHLESLDLEGCCDLVELHMPFGCPKLKFLNLGYSKLTTLHLRLATNLETLDLKGCSHLVEFRILDECPRLKSLGLLSPKLRTLELGLTPDLETLKVNCENLEELRTPDELDDWSKHLVFSGFPKLKFLSLICSNVETLELTLNLKKLILDRCSLVELQIPNGDVKLESLNFQLCSYSKTLDLGRTPNLKSLHLDEYSRIKFHAPVDALKELIHLLNPSGLLKQFDILGQAGLLPELYLSVKYFENESSHPPDKKVANFQFEGFVRADQRSSIGNIENFISVGLSNHPSRDLESFFGSICGLQHLRKLTLNGGILEAPKDLDRLQYLEELTLMSTEIKHLPDSICMFKHLKKLELYICMALEKLPEDLDRLECLEILILSECEAIKTIPNKICSMKRLKYFVLSYCKKVKELPEELGLLECLEELNVEGTHINHLPQGILTMKKGLRIVGSRELLESCDLTSKIQTSEYETFCYI